MNQNNHARILGIASFTLSLLGIGCLAAIIFIQSSALWLSALCIAFSVTALILGAVSRKNQREQNPFTLAGLIISIVTHALSGLGKIG